MTQSSSVISASGSTNTSTEIESGSGIVASPTTNSSANSSSDSGITMTSQTGSSSSESVIGWHIPDNSDRMAAEMDDKVNVINVYVICI